MAQAKGASAANRANFLAELARTANVTAAAKAGAMSTTAVYRLRASDAGFRAKWHAALCEGYARLETMMLEEALTRASAATSEGMLKARAQKHRLQLALLTAHRASVRGERGDRILVQRSGGKRAKAELIEKFDLMAARTADVADGDAKRVAD
ncbi:MAG: hypothetical protein H2056_09680 [Sphingopyxis sp.]|nr:hypothetical protein [Sphingopyxis sp.]